MRAFLDDDRRRQAGPGRVSWRSICDELISLSPCARNGVFFRTRRTDHQRGGCHLTPEGAHPEREGRGARGHQDRTSIQDDEL